MKIDRLMITETIEFWIMIYVLEFTILGQTIIGNHLKQKIMRSLYSVFSRMLFGILFVVVIIILIPYDPQLMYFWAAAMVSVWVWMASLFISKKSDEKIKEVLDRVKRIEERLDGLHKK